MSLSKSKRKFACNARFLFCKDGAICAKNSPKRTSHGAARTIVKLNSLRSPFPDYGFLVKMYSATSRGVFSEDIGHILN